MLTDTVVHNSTNCKQEGACVVDGCHEFALGDHFPSVTTVRNVHIELDQEACPIFPNAWHSHLAWGKAFNRASECLSGICEIVGRVDCSNCASARYHEKVQVYVINLLAWILAVIAGVVRDVWVHPRRKPADHQPPPSSYKQDCMASHTRSVCLMETAAEEVLQRGGSQRLLLQCLKFLKPESPSICSKLFRDGVHLVGDAYHQAWCEKVVQQSQLNVRPAINDRVEMNCTQTLSRQRAAMRRSDGGVLFSEQDTYNVVQDWGDSGAMPPDLVPRAAFQSLSHWWMKAV